MGNYENLKQSITEVIRTNGNKEITGAVLQSTLLTIISTVGANATFAGIATPTTNPGTPDGSVFWLASERGTYSNFGSIELQNGLSVLLWNGSWSGQQIFSIDDEPTFNSQNLVKSGGVFKKIAGEVTIASNRGTYTAQYLKNFFADNYLFQGDGIVYTASTTAVWQGIIFTINNPIIGKKIHVNADRIGGLGDRYIKLAWYDASSVIHENTFFSGNSVDYVIPSGAVKFEIVLSYGWNNGAIAVGDSCTFNNVDIYYYDVDVINNLTSSDTKGALSAAMGNKLKSLVDRVAIMVPSSDIIFDISTWKITLPANTFIKRDSLKYTYQLLEDTVIDAVNNAATSIVLFDWNAKTFSCVPWDTDITALDKKYVVCNCITQIQGNIVDCLYGQAYTVNGGSLPTTYTKVNEKINSINNTAFSINSNAGTVTHTLFELKQRDNYLFQGDNIVYTATVDNKWQGLVFTIDKPIVGRVLHVNADRIGGYGNNYIRFTWYDAENVAHVGNFYSGNSANYTIPDGAIKIIVLLSVAWNETGGETAGQVYPAGTQCTFNNVDIYYVENGVSEEDFEELVIGSGEYPYYGVRKLDITFNTYKMKMNILMTRKYSDSPEAEPHTYRSIQSIAIYDGIIFGFLQGQGCYLFDFNTLEDIGFMNVSFFSHSNSAQFTDVFYNENDRFPLLLLSRCDYSTGKTSVLRITESNGVYSCTLVKDIVIDTYAFKTYGGSACADLNRRKLIVTHTLNGDWRVTTNNPAVLEEFDLPDLTSPEETVYTEADGKTLAYNPFYVIQGMTYDNGYIYQAAQLKNNNFLDRYGVGNISCIIVFDAASGEIRNIIPSNSYEPEGIAVYNNKLYLQAANQEGSGDNIVFWLHEYQF